MLTYVGSQLAPLHTGQGKPEESAAEHIARKIKDTSSVHTLLFYQIESLKNGASLVLPSSLFRGS